MELTKKLYQNIPEKYKYQILRTYFLIKNPKFIFTPYQAKLHSTQPVLIISMPRSGSSWVGKVLSHSTDTLYLREPISQAHRLNFPAVQSEYTNDALEHSSYYKKCALNAFEGPPNFIHSSIFKPARWHEAGEKVRVIKEINPLFLNYIMDKFQPKIIYLARNPAAVANSYFNQKWLSNRFKRAFTDKEYIDLQEKYSFKVKNEFWHDFGLFQSVVDTMSMATLDGYKDKLIVKYEDICNNPFDEFKKLYEFSGLDFTEADKGYINKTSSTNTNYKVGNYDTTRNSSEMANKWKTLIAEKDINAIKLGYLSLKDTLYKLDDFK
jgi:hypothetical protein